MFKKYNMYPKKKKKVEYKITDLPLIAQVTN